MNISIDFFPGTAYGLVQVQLGGKRIMIGNSYIRDQIISPSMRLMRFFSVTWLTLTFILSGCTNLTAINPTVTAPPTVPAIAEPEAFPFSEPGPYHAGNRVYTLVDENRDGREVKVNVWYPALEEIGDNGKLVVSNASIDRSGAPYPVVITEGDSGWYIFNSHLASYGFVMVSVPQPNLTEYNLFYLIDLVRDFLFALDELASNPPEELAGVLDTGRTGVTGYSYGGDISLFMSGARFNPPFYLSQCEQAPVMEPENFRWIYLEYCQGSDRWDDALVYAGEAITSSEDGLWQPMSDERIRAVMPMAPTVSWYFGEQGLAAVDRPTLLMWGTSDDISPYVIEAGYTYEHLGTEDRYLISFIGKDHFMFESERAVEGVKHFAVAFFGYYLQGRKEYRDSFSEEFVKQYDEINWGVYTGE